MAEVEIHTGHEHSSDQFGQGVGVAVGVIGIILAIVTIGSHRAHTQAVINRTEENDQWSFYQAKKIRQQVYDVGVHLAQALSTDQGKVQDFVKDWANTRDRYRDDTANIEKEAKDAHDRTVHEEDRAVKLDLGEGFLELGLVLSSLYFLAKRKFFPILGVTAAVIGTGLGIYGFLLPG